MQILEEHIKDGRFLHLIRELLDAGYLEDWTFNQTLSGVPQGGIVSPVLANILLDKLDKYVETVLIPKYTTGTRRASNPEYARLRTRAFYQQQIGNVQKAQKLKQQARTIPSILVNDPNYRRLRYIRYADDFLLGFNGPKSEAEELKLELSET